MSAICTNNFIRRSSLEYDNMQSTMNDNPNDIYSDNTTTNNCNDNDNNNDDINDDYNSIENTIRLQLKKPKDWGWELTTSKSSSNISFPRILLYDSNGDLLADAHEADCVFTSADTSNKRDKKLFRSSTISDSGKLSRSSTIIAASPASPSTITTNKRKRRLSSADLRSVQSSLSDFIDQLSEHGIECKLNGKLSRKSSDSILKSNSNLSLERNESLIINRSEENTDNFSDVSLASIVTVSKQKNSNSNKLKSGHQKGKSTSSLNDISKNRIDNKSSGSTPTKEVRFNLHKSQSAFEMNSLWSEKEKRKCRRSKSTEPSKFASSILERMRAFNERTSSSEELDMMITDVDHCPRYYLRTCRAGTLVVCEESFRHKKVRRRPMSIPRISESEETDIKTTMPEKIIQRIPIQNKIITKRKYPNDENKGIDKSLSELCLNEKNLNDENDQAPNYCNRSKSLVFCENNRNRYDDDNIKAQKQKHKKFKKLRRCMSAGTVVCFSSTRSTSSSSSESDDDCSQASCKNVNFRSKRKSLTKSRIEKEKGDHILTVNHNIDNNGKYSGRIASKSTGRITSENLHQTTGNRSSECPIQIDEKSGSDEDLVTNFVHHHLKSATTAPATTTTSTTTETLKNHHKKTNNNHKITDVLDNNNLNYKNLHAVVVESSLSSLLDQHKNQDNLKNNDFNDDKKSNASEIEEDEDNNVDEDDDDDDDNDNDNEDDCGVDYCNTKLLLGQCQNSIENIQVKCAFSNNKKNEVNNNFNENDTVTTKTTTTTTTNTLRNAYNDNILNLQKENKVVLEDDENDVVYDEDELEEFELEYAKICDYNNNDNDNNNENFYDNDDDDNDNDNEYYTDFIENNCNYYDNSTYVVEEITTPTTATNYKDKNYTDSETETVLNFDQIIINKNNKKYFSNEINSNNNNNNKNNIIKKDYIINHNMGSNVSRNSGNGFSGRRTQSSGNLYTGKHGGNNTSTTACSYSSNLNPSDKFNSTLSSGIIVGVQNGNACKQQTKQQLSSSASGCNNNTVSKNRQLTESITKKDRNKFCGSLPNHLDDTEDEKNTGIKQQLDRIDVITSLEEEDDELNEKQQKYRQPFASVAPTRQHNQDKHQQQPFQQQQQQQQLNSSSNTISSGVESSVTQPSTDSFRSSSQVKADVQLKLPLVRSNADPSCDQGYGSERSPEDELPPAMPDLSSIPFQYLQNYNMDWDYSKCIQNPYCYSFITKDCIFSLQITKGSRGLGLSISGGIDSNSAFPGLIRIKRLFPHQPAWSTGKLQPGDIILEANEVPLTGLTNYEALEVLRTMPNEVLLLVCRPSDEEYKRLSPPADPPKPPSRQTQQQATQTSPEDYPLQPLSPLQLNFTGEFEIIMVKQQGSLGFTLRKEDESVLGHYVRALVREPATTDGRIKPGDKIVAVNDVPLSPMTHEQAVIFLRQAADTVKLRLYRDGAQTPVAAMSPNTESKTFCNASKKTILRPEAINLLSDLAYKKQITPVDSTESSLISNSTSPRRLRRANKQTSESISQSEIDTCDSKSSSNQQYVVSSQSASLYSDSEQSASTSQCSYRALPINLVDSGDFVRSENSDSEKPDRPNFLDLASSNGSNVVVSRKPRFQFTVATNINDLTNFENDSIDDSDSGKYLESLDYVTVPKLNSQTDDQQSITSSTNKNSGNSNSNSNCHAYTSLPCETFLIACKTESDLKDEANFSYKNPMYQSAHVQASQNDEVPLEPTKKDGNSSLLKWKGVVLSPDSEEEKKFNKEINETETVQNDENKSKHSTSIEAPSSNPTVTVDKPKIIILKNTFSSTSINAEGHKIISVELNRGWNSRLGFSLQSDSNTNKTVISAIYSDSVAAKDGRLRVGDQLLTVNDESVEDMQTSDIIDLLRILRGSIFITVLRKIS